MGPTPTDADLIAGSDADPASFELLFERHFDAIFRYLRRRVGTAVAEDLAAQTFIHAFEGRASYHVDQPSARPWLFGIATNMLRRHWRTERRELLAYARLGRDPLEDEFDAVERAIDSDALGPVLAEAIARLNEGDRDVLLLFAWGEQSYEEIGLALDIPVGTVRSRLARARRITRELLAAKGQMTEEARTP